MVDVFAYRLIRDWNIGQQIIAITRRRFGPGIWENFEYLVVEAQRFAAKRPEGDYPKGVPRLPIVDQWLAADRKP